MSHDEISVYNLETAELPGDALMPGSPTAARPPEAPAQRAGASPALSVPVRASSVVTGLERACRAELVGFASPIGRLSAVLRITDEATGNTTTSVVPVELPARIEGRPDEAS
jgi:hypothetical protein